MQKKLSSRVSNNKKFAIILSLMICLTLLAGCQNGSYVESPINDQDELYTDTQRTSEGTELISGELSGNEVQEDSINDQDTLYSDGQTFPTETELVSSEAGDNEIVERKIIETTDDAINQDMAAREAYAVILRNLLYSGILPDGTTMADGYHSEDSAQFAVSDVDGDGKEELVLLYDPGITAGAVGYIIGYDRDRGMTYVELVEYPFFQFYSNGAVKAMWSHNQGYGEMWPYNLYEYQPDTDSYTQVGEVDSWNREYKEKDFPDDIDTDGTGVVYYVNVDQYSGGQPVSEADYLAWLEPYLQGASELSITYQYLYDESIAAIE